MKVLLLFVTIALCSAEDSPAPKRAKRELYSLPDGADIIVGAIKTTFQCPGDGYYADMDNNCQIFHVCHTTEHANGALEQQQWSFMCGNQTIFNQFSLTCAMPQESIGCHESANFFYTNPRLRAGPLQYFLDEDDVARAQPLIAAMYRSIVGGAAAVGGAATGGGRGRG